MQGAGMPITFERREESRPRGVRLPVELDETLKEIAKEEGVSLNQVLVALLKSGLQHYERQVKKLGSSGHR